MPPKDKIFEYIVFRGSDIKDITVSEPPKPHHGLPCDPAIVQVCDSRRFGSLNSELSFHFWRCAWCCSKCTVLTADKQVPFVLMFVNLVICRQLLCRASPTLESIQGHDAHLQPAGCEFSTQPAVQCSTELGYIHYIYFSPAL